MRSRRVDGPQHIKPSSKLTAELIISSWAMAKRWQVVGRSSSFSSGSPLQTASFLVGSEYRSCRDAG